MPGIVRMSERFWDRERNRNECEYNTQVAKEHAPIRAVLARCTPRQKTKKMSYEQRVRAKLAMKRGNIDA